MARGVILLSSTSWFRSKWCFAELELAKEFRKQIIPLNLTSRHPPAEISHFQTIPFNKRNDHEYRGLWTALDRAGLRAEDDFAWPRDECPYPGLAAFQEEHAGVYFGREKELADFDQEHLEPMWKTGTPRLVFVIGPSGSGKSSFVRAGVLPRLKFKSRNPWQVITVFRWSELECDGRSWGERLAHDIWRLYGNHRNRPKWNAEDLASRYAINKQGTIEAVSRRFVLDVKDLVGAVAPTGATPLIVLDQFEELLLQDDNALGRGSFLQFIKHCLADRSSPCRAIATVRSDFLPAIQEDPSLISWNEQTELFRLDLLKNERLFDIVRRPAELVSVRFENDALVNQIVDEANTSDALPLLAFTLKRFYDTCAERGVFSRVDYEEELGGLQRCLQTVAEKVLEDTNRPNRQIDPENKNALRVCFVNHLVRYQEGESGNPGTFVKKRAKWSDLPIAAHDLLEKMSSEDFRLLSIDRRGDSITTVEITHESLLRNWDTLVQWLEARRGLLKWRADIQRELGPAWSVLNGAQLAESRKWATECASDLTAAEKALIHRSRIWRLRWFAAGLVVILIAAVLWGAWKTSGFEIAISNLTTLDQIEPAVSKFPTWLISCRPAGRALRRAVGATPPDAPKALKWVVAMAEVKQVAASEIATEQAITVEQCRALWRLVANIEASDDARVKSGCLLALRDPKNPAWDDISEDFSVLTAGYLVSTPYEINQISTLLLPVPPFPLVANSFSPIF